MCRHAAGNKGRMEGVDLDFKKAGYKPVPLCTLFPGVNLGGSSSKWVLEKVSEIQDCLGDLVRVSKTYFRALLIVNEVGHSPSSKSASK